MYIICTYLLLNFLFQCKFSRSYLHTYSLTSQVKHSKRGSEFPILVHNRVNLHRTQNVLIGNLFPSFQNTIYFSLSPICIFKSNPVGAILNKSFRKIKIKGIIIRLYSDLEWARSHSSRYILFIPAYLFLKIQISMVNFSTVIGEAVICQQFTKKREIR